MNRLSAWNYDRKKETIAKPGNWGCWPLLLLFCIFTNGCALTTDRILIEYEPQSGMAKLSGAEKVTIVVDVMDIRADRGRVGSKKNGYGMEMAPIVAENSVPVMLSKAIESELANRGFVLGTGAGRLLVELQKFYNDFKVGFWSGSAVAELVLNVQVKDSNGNILFAKIVTGDGSLDSIQLASGENAKIALERALKNGLTKLFDDKAYIDALFMAGRIEDRETLFRQPSSATSNISLKVNDPL